VVYFPWDIDRTYWEILNEDHGLLLRNAAQWVSGRLPVTVEGPGLLDVTVWRQRASVTVYLVNLTNPRTQKGPVREIYPLGAQRLCLTLPRGTQVRSVQLLSGQQEPANVHVDDHQLYATIPAVETFEVLAVDLA